VRPGPRARVLALLVLGAALLLGAVDARSGDTVSVWQSSFTKGLEDWGPPVDDWGGLNREYLDVDGVSGRVLRVHLSKGGIDPRSMVLRGRYPSGTGFKGRVIRPPVAEAELTYLVRFAPGFKFVRGGKLPGLFGGRGNSGGKIPDGRDGFSLRLMWLTGGRAQVYAYLPTSKRYGTSLIYREFGFLPGKWHRVVQRVRLNKPGASDGEVRIEVDGVEAGRAVGLRFRDVESLGIEGVFFDVFFGGGDDSWAAEEDTWIDFADFKVVARP